MASQKHDKHQEDAYRRGYHQAASECLRLIQAAADQRVDVTQVLEVFERWEHQLAIWRGTLETGRLLDPPPHPGGPRLRLVERDEEQEDEQVDQRSHEGSVRVRSSEGGPGVPSEKQVGDQPRYLPDKAAAQAAVATLKTRLQEAFVNADFLVRASLQRGTARSFRGYQITVDWTDGPSQTQVETICGEFAPQISFSRRYSVEFLRQVATRIFRSYGLPVEQLEISVHESSGSAYIVSADWQFLPGVGHIDQVVSRQLKDIAQAGHQ
jgi:hypothetical protein